jgi:N6-adenosine-specific RNA methylase IME4
MPIRRGPFKTYSGDAIPARASRNGLATAHYQTMPIQEICSLPVSEIAAEDCCLFHVGGGPLLTR